MPLCCATRSSVCARRQTKNHDEKNRTPAGRVSHGRAGQAVQDRLLQPQLFKAASRGRGGYERASAERASARQQKTPSIRAIADRLDDLHGASVGALVRKKGEVQLTGLFADCLEDQYAGETVFLQLLDFVSELLFCPQMENSAFLPQLVQQERQNLQNAMQSVLDDKGAYCERQMLRSMCRGERYACGRLGEPEELDAIDARTLWTHYESLLASSRVELFISAVNLQMRSQYSFVRFWRSCRVRPASWLRPLPVRSRRHCGGFPKRCRSRKADFRWASARM